MGAEQRKDAAAFLAKAQEYLESAQASALAGRYTPAAGDAIHAGISAKDAIVTALTGSTGKGRDHALAAKELRAALPPRENAALAERALRELISAKSDVEDGTMLITPAKAKPLIRRARSLVDLAIDVIRLGR